MRWKPFGRMWSKKRRMNSSIASDKPCIRDGRARAAIGSAHRREVQLIDEFHHEARQMPLRQPILDRRRQQMAGPPVNGAEVVHGGTAKLEESTARDCPYANGKVKSDRLLDWYAPREVSYAPEY